MALRIFNIYTGQVVDTNSKEKNKNVLRNKVHIEHATGYKQMQPTKPIRQQKEN